MENPEALVSFYINKFCVTFGFTVADFATRYTPKLHCVLPLRTSLSPTDVGALLFLCLTSNCAHPIPNVVHLRDEMRRVAGTQSTALALQILLLLLLFLTVSGTACARAAACHPAVALPCHRPALALPWLAHCANCCGRRQGPPCVCLPVACLLACFPQRNRPDAPPANAGSPDGPPAPSTKLRWKLLHWPPHVDLMTNQQFGRLKGVIGFMLLAILGLLAASLGTVVNGNVFKRRVWGPAMFGPSTRASTG